MAVDGTPELSTARRLQAMEKSGLIKRKYRGIYLVNGAPESFAQEAAAAAAAGAICSHRCAAALLHLQGVPPHAIEVVTLGTSPTRRFGTSVTVHRTNHLPDSHIGERDGIAITSVPRTLLDLGSVVPYQVVRRATLSALDRNLVTPEELQAQLRCCGRSGRGGTQALRQLAAELEWPDDRSDSDLEDIALELIIGNGFPKPERLFEVFEAGILVGEVDLAYPDHRVGIEVDSYGFHSSRPAFVKDRGRWNGLLSRGWTILFFVHEDSLRPRRFFSDLARALNRPN